jgi:uncharacterized membrane protein
MQLAPLSLPFGRSAYLSAAVTFATLITGILFFAVDERFGKVNDAASVLQILFMLPIAVGLFLVLRAHGAGSLIAVVIGIAAMLTIAPL